MKTIHEGPQLDPVDVKDRHVAMTALACNAVAIVTFNGVITWLDEAAEDRVFLSVATFPELRHGVERLARGARRKKLDSWLREELPLRFESRVLAVTAEVADEWGRA